MKSLDIIIPLYDSSMTIERTLNIVCLASCTKTDFLIKIILVDDNSSDNCLEKARTFLKTKDIPSTFIKLYKNYGQSIATWVAIYESEADIILTIDADLYGFSSLDLSPAFLLDTETHVISISKSNHSSKKMRVAYKKISSFIIKRILVSTLMDPTSTYKFYSKDYLKNMQAVISLDMKYLPYFSTQLHEMTKEITPNLTQTRTDTTYSFISLLGIFVELIVTKMKPPILYSYLEKRFLNKLLEAKLTLKKY